MWWQSHDTHVIIIHMSHDPQKQYRYKAIQALVEHLDNNASESCSIKQGILETLSQCVAVAADGSLGIYIHIVHVSLSVCLTIH